MPPKSLVHPKEPFACEWDGFTQSFLPDRIFESDHPLVKKFASRFVPVEPTDRVESATAEPGEKRNR